MKKYIYLLVCLIFVITTGFTLSSGGGFPNILKKKLDVFLNNYPEEKIYLQTDKTFYKQEEDIWFSAFLLDATTHKPSDLSDVIYVELQDPKGNVISKREISALNGVARGDFELSETAPGGIYTLTAYTKWMKNFGEERFFKKELIVQKVITPRLLLKLDYEKKAYGPGDDVAVSLTVENLENQKVNNGLVKASIRIAGNEINNLSTSTDKEGKSRLAFVLPQSLHTSDGLLQVLVSAGGVEESISRSIPIVLNNIKLQFFPEGGNLCENVESRVAFEALNEFGKGADVSGEIIDEVGNVITRFESFHQGMGAFEFTPHPGKAYKARIVRPVGNDTPFDLPKAFQSTYVMNLKEQSKDKIKWIIHAPNPGSVTLMVHVRGELYENRQVLLTKGANIIESDVKKFPAGIAVFTLFDDKETAVCERLVFVNNDKVLNIKVKTDKEYYRPKEKVTLDIQTTDNDGKPVAANIALSVVDKQILSFADDKQDNILTYMLLSSELKGKIQEPSFYFDKKEEKAPAAIDYLLLTHGWRRFTWSDVINPNIKLTEGPEKVNDIFGYVVDDKGLPKQAEIYLIEYGKKQRVAKLKTTSGGQFVFHNVDVSGDVVIATKLPNRVYVFKKKPAFRGTDLVRSVDLTDNTVVGSVEEEYGSGFEQERYPIEMFSKDNRVTLSSQSSMLEEVVVVGYGTSARQALSGVVTTVYRREEIMNSSSVETALQGRIPGLIVSEQNIAVGKNSINTIILNGIKSLAKGGSYPVLVLDGVLLNEPINSNFSNWDLINTNNIQSVVVFNAASASSAYGSKASTGAIVLMTKTAYFPYKETKQKFAGTRIPMRQFYEAKNFEDNQDDSEERNNFNTTVYWNGDVKTNANGKTTVVFHNNDATSSFKATAEGISPEGVIGRSETDYSTKLPVSIDAKVPEFITSGDTIQIPVMLRNTTEKARTVDVRYMLPVNEKSGDKFFHTHGLQTVTIPGGETKTIYFPYTSSGGLEGEYSIYFQMESKDSFDQIIKKVSVRSIGFPMRVSLSGRGTEQTGSFMLKDVEGFVNMEAICYTNIFDDLQKGAESIFREPYGCFEQLSSSTFPNIFALQFLNASKKMNPDQEKMGLGYIDKGYKKLAAYEVNGGGFEWYGGSPAHEVLSAYGLLEFYEMKKVYSGVDEKMMKRTLDFILSRRDNAGGFRQNRGKYGFSAAPKDINNAYIVYALAETGYKDIIPEYNACLKDAWKTKDPYCMALMANAAFSLRAMDDYSKLISYFKNLAENSDLKKMKINNSIVWSSGTPLLNETLALWCIALLKNENDVSFETLDECLKIMTESRKFGGFGGTQATSLCLQALTKYALFLKVRDFDGTLTAESDAQHSGGTLTVKLNDSIVISGKISAGATFLKTKTDPPFKHYGYRLDEKNTVSVTADKVRYPYSINLSWSSMTPPESSQLCPLRLSLSLEKNQVRMNDIVRLSATLTNTRNLGQPMSIAIIGIPSGLSVQSWQLKEMKEKGIFDFYEILDGKLVVYYRELGSKEVKTINLDLKADIPGKYNAAASSAYLYYSDAYKYWVKGCKINVTKD